MTFNKSNIICTPENQDISNAERKMKTILLILGPNGVGKSTTAKIILEKMPHTALVDSDWCRAMNPYNMDTVILNTYGLIKNYLNCIKINTVIFHYGFHGDRKKRFDTVMAKLREDGIIFVISTVILTCSLDENITRAQKDSRNDERIKRGIENTFHYYDGYDYPKIDTMNLTAPQVAEKIIDLYNKEITI